MVQRQDHWRAGEGPQPLVERAVAAEKGWGVLHQLPPSTELADAYEAELHLGEPDTELERMGSFFLQAHQEHNGAIFIRLWHGERLLRRAHIGGGHQEPDHGPYFPGPHIHFPTTVFRVIDSRRAGTRVYDWSVPESISLRDAITGFAVEIDLVGEPVERKKLSGG